MPVCHKTRLTKAASIVVEMQRTSFYSSKLNPFIFKQDNGKLDLRSFGTPLNMSEMNWLNIVKLKEEEKSKHGNFMIYGWLNLNRSKRYKVAYKNKNWLQLTAHRNTFCFPSSLLRHNVLSICITLTVVTALLKERTWKAITK